MPRSARAHAKDVRRRRWHLTPEQRFDPAYTRDPPNGEICFACEHEELRRRGVRNMGAGTLPPLVVHYEDQEADAAYQEALAVVLRESGRFRCRRLCRAVVRLAVPRQGRAGSTALKTEKYIWEGGGARVGKRAIRLVGSDAGEG
ncbi:hypothetical protein D1007_39014 [Hordeum vulgare]|nr:hypothetical protein D1007_39014 [Hordeum vulgare]